ncbi:MAG TPA: class I SAM-dependent methyltransferase [Mycobacterium sp.]|uniref:class I SAM-dependent methyltransferase n=1 Tax=Mycolicibacterium sp. TaxID=2320850 RepID=UPI0025EA38BA|nr:class I SAM-dependent methyltransferase [Mycolicibacterium sp.]HPX36909.1 class I SAM-dependent methyltransferase [Mycobacterium sp.]HQC76983.1 class I SAM-dependent methyltransferase [Mycobacterium sp.]
MVIDREGIDGQRRHWRSTFEDNPTMYGTQPSEPGRYAVELFTGEAVRDVAELGVGQGRDTLAFLHAGMTVTALDYADEGLAELRATAAAAGVGDRLSTIVSDARKPLPLPDSSVDAVYSHMLFNMALSTPELERLAAEIHRVLRPGGLHVYTVRHIGDAHYRAGSEHGDNMFGNGGFIVHFFDQELVDRLAAGFQTIDQTSFEEGALPRRLWRITQRKM